MDSRKHFVACRECGNSPDFDKQILRQRLTCLCRTSLQLAVKRVWHVTDLNHLGHVQSMIACVSHVNMSAPGRGIVVGSPCNGSSNNRGAWRNAFECVRPMKP